MRNRQNPEGPAPRRLVRLVQVEQNPGYTWATTRWLRRQVYEGTLPSVKVAGSVLIDLDDLDAMVEAGRRQGAA